jgi:hypothetical protein
MIDYVILEASFEPMYEGELLFMEIARMMEEQRFRFDRPVSWPARLDSAKCGSECFTRSSQ